MLRRIAANRWVRWLGPFVVLVILVVAFRDQLPFLGDGIRRLRNAEPAGVLVAVIATFLSLAAMAEVMRLLLGAGGTRVSPASATGLTLASNSWSTSLPGGPAFSAVLTYQVQRSWGASRLLCGWFLVLSSAVSTMWLVLIGVSGVFFLGAQVSVWSLLATLAAMTVLSWVVYWAANNPDHLERWTRALLPVFNRMLHRAPDTGLEAVVNQLHQFDTVHLSRGRFAAVSGWSLLNRLFDALALYSCVWAITGTAPGLEATPDHTTVMGVMLAYTTAKLAGTAQVTPGGLGTVEAVIIATLVTAGMTAVDATGVALVYRLVSFALATIVGWVVYFLYFAGRSSRASRGPTIELGHEQNLRTDR
nr:YbhN family protein [Corynebacterium hylobatis]